MAEFRLLGPVGLLVSGRPRDLGTAKQRLVLAALLVDVNHAVTLDTLIDRVWDDPPDQARSVVYAHLSRIRRLLATVPDTESIGLERGGGAYVLRMNPDRIDLHRFRRLAAQAHTPDHDDTRRAALLREATGLWRGTPLNGLSGQWADGVRETLRRQRLDAVLQCAEAELRLARPAEVIRTLHPLLAEHPLVEPLAAQFMVALTADGRSAEALDYYTAVRRNLADSLGTEPGPELRRVHREILRGEGPSASFCAVGGHHVGRHPVPAQLPADLPGFAGRSEHLACLDELLDKHEARNTAGPLVVAIGGAPGVGKTALALHWAHRIADRFSDGQLYVNLRGFAPAASPMPPGEAVRICLDALGAAPEQTPGGLPAQAGLYRSMVAGKRMLMVLDNAHDAAQVRALLPGSANCMVLITSRNQLTGLVAVDGAHPLTLDVPTAHEARQLLARRIGEHRMIAEPDAAREIIARCARLPLALAIVAARAATHPQFRLDALAKDLRTAQHNLNAFAGGDADTDVRTVFSWSYRSLGPAASRLFRLLGTHPGMDIGVPAAARLADIELGEAYRLLADLDRAHLVAEHQPGRFTSHDLLRAYATEQAHATDPVEERHAALRRVLDHYLYTAHAADRLLHPHRDPIDLDPAPVRAAALPIADTAQAMAWFTTEHQVLLAAVNHCAELGLAADAWRLTWALSTFLDRGGHWHDWADIHRISLRAAQRANDVTGQICAHRGLAAANVRLRLYDDAHAQLLAALDLLQSIGDALGQARIRGTRCWVFDQQGDYASCLAEGRRALELYRTAGHRSGQARILNIIGWSQAMLGDHHQSFRVCGEAMRLLEELGDLSGQAVTWHSLGYAYHRSGDHPNAIRAFQRAVDLSHELDDWYGEARMLGELAEAYLAGDELASGRRAWQRALDILEELGDPGAERVREYLSAVDAHE